MTNMRVSRILARSSALEGSDRSITVSMMKVTLLEEYGVVLLPGLLREIEDEMSER